MLHTTEVQTGEQLSANEFDDLVADARPLVLVLPNPLKLAQDEVEDVPRASKVESARLRNSHADVTIENNVKLVPLRAIPTQDLPHRVRLYHHQIVQLDLVFFFHLLRFFVRRLEKLDVGDHVVVHDFVIFFCALARRFLHDSDDALSRGSKHREARVSRCIGRVRRGCFREKATNIRLVR